MITIKIKLVFIFICFSIISYSQSFYSRPEQNNQHLYGIVDANDNWILSPRYHYIGDFYDYNFKNVKEYSIFEEIKNINGVDKTTTGLLNNKGKVLIPSEYYYLDCNEGLCLAFDDNYGGKKIIDFKNNVVEESPFTIFKLKDSIIFYSKGNEQYFKKIGSKKSFGPYNKLEFDKKEKIIYAEESATKKLLHYDGSIFIDDPDIYNNYKGEFLFADDIYLKNIAVPNYQGKKITFASKNSNTTFGKYVRIDVSEDRDNFLSCIETSHGRGFEECHGPSFSIFQIETELKKGLILDRNSKKYIKINNKVALLNREGKIVSKFYDYKDSTNKYDFELFETENNKTKFVILNEDGKELLKSSFPVIYYSEDFQLLFDEKNHEYFADFKNKKVEIKNKDFKKITVNSKTYNSDIYELYGDGKYFYINKKGKIIDNADEKTTSKNFYNNRAFYRKSGKYSIINEKFEVVKEIDSNINFIGEISQNGNAICTTDMKNNVGFGFKNIINVMTGKLLSDKKYERVLSFENNLYLGILDSQSNTYQSWWKYEILDKQGNVILQQDKEYESNSYGTKENYIYFRVGYDYYFYDNNGVFIGKNVLNKSDN